MKIEYDEKFKDFLKSWWNIHLNRDYPYVHPYVPIPKLMRNLSKKWNVPQKEVKDYIAQIPFQNGQFFVSLCAPGKGMPKTQMIFKGHRTFYFVHVCFSERKNSELRDLRFSDLDKFLVKRKSK